MASSADAAGQKAVATIRYKIATASADDDKLSEVLQNQLVPLLEKAGSPHKAVRDAVRLSLAYSKFPATALWCSSDSLELATRPSKRTSVSPSSSSLQGTCLALPGLLLLLLPLTRLPVSSYRLAPCWNSTRGLPPRW